MDEKFINQSYTARLVYTIMFDIDAQYDELDEWCLGINILKSLKNMVEYHVNNNELTEEIKLNIFKYLDFVRSYDDKYKNTRIEVANEIIRILNVQKSSNAGILYRMELYKRTRNKKNLVTLDENEIYDKIEWTNYSIAEDSYIMMCLSEYFTSDEEFYVEYFEDLVENQYFYATIKALLYEVPVLFKDKVFYDRIIQVLDRKLELNNAIETKKESKNIKKLIKKNTRKIKE